MPLEKLVVFLCKFNEWNKYKTSNPGFQKHESWLFHVDDSNNRAFWVTTGDSDSNSKNALPEEDERQVDWCKNFNKRLVNSKLVQLDNNTEVIVFIHWGETNDIKMMKEPSMHLQELLRAVPEYSKWQIYSLSSHNMDVDVGPIGRVFDVSDPVVPVSNFDAWFEMYKQWWNDGPEAVNNEYANTPFPSHKDGRIDSNSSRCDANANHNANTDHNVNANANTVLCKKNAIGDKYNTTNSVNDATGSRKITAGVGLALWLVGILMSASSLVPVWLTYKCLRVMSFQAKTTPEIIYMLLVALLSTIFAEIILGGIFRMILPRRNADAKE